MTTNDILHRIQTALRLKDPEILIIFGLARSRHEPLPDQRPLPQPRHPKYRPCSEAVLNDFLIGLDAFYFTGQD